MTVPMKKIYKIEMFFNLKNIKFAFLINQLIYLKEF